MKRPRKRSTRTEQANIRIGLGADGTAMVGLISLEALSRGESVRRERLAAHCRRISASGVAGQRKRWLRLAREKRVLAKREKGMPVGGWQSRPLMQKVHVRVLLAFPTAEAAMMFSDIIALTGLQKQQLAPAMYQNNTKHLFEKILNADYDPDPPGIRPEGVSLKNTQFLWVLSPKGQQEYRDLTELRDLMA